MTQNKFNDFELQKPLKEIKIGKIYFIHDRSKSGHPGIVVSKNKIKNRYLIIRFDSDKFGSCTKLQKGTKHITILKHPISALVMNSYVRNRPFLCKRKDIGHEMLDLSVHDDDMDIIRKISKNKPELSYSLRKK